MSINVWLTTIISLLEALPLIEAPPNFEEMFLFYMAFVRVAFGSLNLIKSPLRLLAKPPGLLLGISLYLLFIEPAGVIKLVDVQDNQFVLSKGKDSTIPHEDHHLITVRFLL